MAEEGMEFYYTPISTWISHTLHKTLKHGGKPVLLSEYQDKQESSINDLLNRMQEFNT